jgi:hypothetical protein
MHCHKLFDNQEQLAQAIVQALDQAVGQGIHQRVGQGIHQGVAQAFDQGVSKSSRLHNQSSVNCDISNLQLNSKPVTNNQQDFYQLKEMATALSMQIQQSNNIINQLDSQLRQSKKALQEFERKLKETEIKLQTYTRSSQKIPISKSDFIGGKPSRLHNQKPTTTSNTRPYNRTSGKNYATQEQTHISKLDQLKQRNLQQTHIDKPDQSTQRNLQQTHIAKPDQSNQRNLQQSHISKPDQSNQRNLQQREHESVLHFINQMLSENHMPQVSLELLSELPETSADFLEKQTPQVFPRQLSENDEITFLTDLFKVYPRQFLENDEIVFSPHLSTNKDTRGPKELFQHAGKVSPQQFSKNSFTQDSSINKDELNPFPQHFFENRKTSFSPNLSTKKDPRVPEELFPQAVKVSPQQFSKNSFRHDLSGNKDEQMSPELLLDVLKAFPEHFLENSETSFSPYSARNKDENSPPELEDFHNIFLGNPETPFSHNAFLFDAF